MRASPATRGSRRRPGAWPGPERHICRMRHAAREERIDLRSASRQTGYASERRVVQKACRKPALCGTARRCPMKGLQIRVWSWSWSSNSKYCAAVAVCVQLPQLIEISAFVRSRRYSSSSLEHDSPADSKIVAGAAILVENGPRATGSIARAIY